MALNRANGEEWGDMGDTDHTPPKIVDTVFEIMAEKFAKYLEDQPFTVTADKDTSHG